MCDSSLILRLPARIVHNLQLENNSKLQARTLFRLTIFDRVCDNTAAHSIKLNYRTVFESKVLGVQSYTLVFNMLIEFVQNMNYNIIIFVIII